MRATVKIASAAIAALFATACVTSSDIQKLQSQISDLQDQVAALKRTASSKEEVQNVNARIAEQTQTLLKSNATLVTKVDAIEDRLNNTQGSVEQTNYRIDRIAQFDLVVNDYPTSDKVPSALLKKGYAYIALGEKAQGIVQLQYVVHEHPKSSEATKAREELKKLGVETR